MSHLVRLVALLAAICTHAAVAGEFTWHGSLEDAGHPADGHYDFRVQLFSGEHAGIGLSEPLELLGVPVTDGSFAADLELDAIAVASGGWLEVAVRGAGEDTYRALPGRSKIAPETMGGACWNLSGNAGVLAGDFLGTTDSAALQLRVNNQPALRIAPATSSPNLIGGHSQNQTATGVQGAVIAGGGMAGNANRVQRSYGSIGGGMSNTVSGNYGTIGGGRGNLASGTVDATVAGGSSNEASGQTSTIGGGFDNVASGLVAVVDGGIGNTASGDRSSIGGGEGNAAGGASSTVGGGFGNAGSGSSSVVGGGSNNTASGNWSTVAGGTGNRATGVNANITGGANNVASGANSHIAGGSGNLAVGAHSTIAGGEGNCTGGRWSWAGGRSARLYSRSVPTDSPCYIAEAPTNSGDGTFMWAGGNASPMLFRYEPNSFVVRASGGTFFWSDEIQYAGVVLRPGAGDWSTLSDRNAKDDIEPLDTAAVLESLVRMPVYRWRWKTEAEGNRHIGPMAQDFHAAYGLNGDDDRHLLSVDTNGVALAAIQGLNAKLERENAELRAQLAALVERQRHLAARLDALDAAQYAARRAASPALAGAARLAGVQ